MIFHRQKAISEGTGDPRPVPGERFTHQLDSDPFLDWTIILGLSLAVAIALVGVDVSVYLDTEARLDAPVSSVSATPAQAIDTAALEKTIDAFNARASEHSALMRGYNAPRDPSLP